MDIEKLVENVAKTAEIYHVFKDHDKAFELVARVWCVIHVRYFDQRDKLHAILLRHCSFAFTESSLVPNKLLAKTNA